MILFALNKSQQRSYAKIITICVLQSKIEMIFNKPVGGGQSYIKKPQRKIFCVK